MISCLHVVSGVESGDEENTTPKKTSSPTELRPVSVRVFGVVCRQESDVRDKKQRGFFSHWTIARQRKTTKRGQFDGGRTGKGR